MENTPINLENILEQAPNWTFAGDYTLLQWMNKISQDLESRANKSSEALSKLNNNVRSINIGLDNVANSLTTLQFGNQFVECRVQDDDETLPNEASTSSEGNSEIEEIPTSQEMLNTFLDNNLKILRNCHEKYSLDLDDSDDDDEEEGPKEKTCIYQPINPYNERPLPFIFGSKDWHAKWHVGLYENQQDNNYSGDEISETFSDTSSNSPTDEQESFESNTEWPSSNSIDNDNYNANIEVRNASSLRGSQALYPATPSIPVKVNKTQTAISESSSMSTPSSSLAKNSKTTKKHSEIKTSRSESVSSVNSKTSAKHVATTSQVRTIDKSLPYRTAAPPFVDLFAEPPEDIESSTSSSISSKQNAKSSLEDYNTTLPKQTQLFNKETPSVFKAHPTSYVDLFAEPPEDVTSTTSSSISSTQNIKRKPVNLFDDDNDDLEDYLLPQQTKKQNVEKTKSSKESFAKEKEFYEDDLMPVHKKKDNLVEGKVWEETQTLTKTQIKDKPSNVPITSKSLFEDDDDDNDDFLKAFVKKSSSKESAKTSLSKTLLFDNDLVTEPSKISLPQIVKEEQKDFLKTSKNTETKTVNIFDDLEDDDEDDLLFNTSNKNKTSVKSVKETKEIETKQNSVQEKDKIDKSSTFHKKSVNLFDDLEKDNGQEDSKQTLETEKIKVDSLLNKKKINLFDDLEDDDDDDFFAVKPKEIFNKIQTSKSTTEPKHELKDKDSKEHTSAESLIKPKEVVESAKQVSIDFNKTKENENSKEVTFEQETNEQILSENSIKTTENLSEPSKNLKEVSTNVLSPLGHEISSKGEGAQIVPQKVSKTPTKANKEQEIENTSSILTKNEQVALPEKKDATKSTREDNILEPTEKPKVLATKPSIEPENLAPSIKSVTEEKILEHTEKPNVLAPKPTKEPAKDRDFESLASSTNIVSTSYNQELNNNKNSPVNSLKSDETTAETPKVSATEISSTVKETESSSNTTKYDFNSVLFLDEPPEDDNEFFETLAKSPSTLNTKYNSIDLENDIYEPDLPKVPITNVNIITSDVADNKSTSLYTGLQLFSDIPPDDEDDLQPSAKESQIPTKRLHSVFYDDFNETLMALEQNQQEIQPSQTIIPNEPPPFATLNEKEKSLSKDVVDHKLPEIKTDIQHKLPELKPKENQEVVLRKSDPKSSESSKKRPVSKLQMPNININVQALLPGANTTLRKAKEDSKKLSDKESETIIPQEKTLKEVMQTNKKELITTNKKESITVPRTAETEHILPSVTKTRVRAPAARRPSTRKARQDNYRKSQMEEENQAVEVLNETQNDNSSKKEEKQVPKYPSNVRESQEKPALDVHKQQPVNMAIFDDINDDGEDIFKKIKTQNKPQSISKTTLPQEIQKSTTTKEQKKQNLPKEDKSPITSKHLDDVNSEVNKITAEKPRTSKEPSPNGSKMILAQKTDKPSTSSLILDDKENDKDNSDTFKNLKGNLSKNNTEIQSHAENFSKSSLQKVDKKLSASLLFDDEDEEDFFKHIKSTKETQNKVQTSEEQLTEDNRLNQSKLKASTKPTSSSQISEKVTKDNFLKPAEIVTQTSISTKSEGNSSLTANLKQTEKIQEDVTKLETKKNPSELKPSAVSFLDDDDNENDSLFGISNATKSTVKKPETSKQISTKSLENEHLFDKPSTSLQNPLNPQKSAESIRTKESNQKAKAEFKSFLDNDTDDDEDFTVAGLQTTKSKTTPTLPSYSSKTSTQKSSSNKNTAATLFSDSDTDSEDLFAKISSSKSLSKPLNKTKDFNKIQQDSKISKNKPQSSLFSDDSDGDDFLKTSESSSKNITSKSSIQEKKPKVVPQSNASLFSDIDSDEDDLFGGGASKSTKASSTPTVKTSATTTQTMATTTPTSKPKTMADNPLADLL